MRNNKLMSVLSVALVGLMALIFFPRATKVVREELRDWADDRVAEKGRDFMAQDMRGFSYQPGMVIFKTDGRSIYGYHLVKSQAPTGQRMDNFCGWDSPRGVCPIHGESILPLDGEMARTLDLWHAQDKLAKVQESLEESMATLQRQKEEEERLAQERRRQGELQFAKAEAERLRLEQARLLEEHQPIIVPAGTPVRVRIAKKISTRSDDAGTIVPAILDESIFVNGVEVFRQGANAQLRVVSSQDAGRVKGVASMTLALASVDGVDVWSNSLVFEADSTKKKDALKATLATGAGSLIGALLGGKKGALRGAGAGGASGTGWVMSTKGKAIEFGKEQRFEFSLARDVSVSRFR